MADDNTQPTGVNPQGDDNALSASPAEESNVTPPVQETPAQEGVKPEQYVPYSRFKEVVDKVHSLESSLAETAQKQAAPSDQPVSPWQPNSWDEVLNAAEQRVLTKLQSEQLQKQKELEDTTQYIERTLSELEGEGKKFDRNKFLDFALDLATNGMGDLRKAHELFEQIGAKEHAKDVMKADQRGKLTSRNVSPVAEPAVTTIQYSRVHNKSLDELIADSLEES